MIIMSVKNNYYFYSNCTNMLYKNTLLFGRLIMLMLVMLLKLTTATAQVSGHDEEKRGSLYFGAGYSMSYYNQSTIHIHQGKDGNSYGMSNMAGSNSSTPSTPFSASKLSYQLGYFFNYDQTWGVELSYDPAIYYVKNQKATISGTFGGLKTTTPIDFSAANGFSYSLNGSGLILASAVKRIGLFLSPTHKVRIDAMLKAGIGPAIPKAMVTLYGSGNAPKYQLAGINGGLSAALRATLLRYLYLEVAAKYDYEYLYGLKIHDGTAKQNLSMETVTGTIGFTLPTTHRHPFFLKQEKPHRIITIKPMYPSIQ